MTRDRSLLLLAAVATLCATGLLRFGSPAADVGPIVAVAVFAVGRVSGVGGERP